MPTPSIPHLPTTIVQPISTYCNPCCTQHQLDDDLSTPAGVLIHWYRHSVPSHPQILSDTNQPINQVPHQNVIMTFHHYSSANHYNHQYCTSVPAFDAPAAWY